MHTNNHNKPSKGQRLNWVKTAQPVRLNENIKPEKLSDKDLSSNRQTGKDKLLVP